MTAPKTPFSPPFEGQAAKRPHVCDICGSRTRGLEPVDANGCQWRECAKCDWLEMLDGFTPAKENAS